MAGVKGRSGGRNAKSTQSHVIQGTFRKDRHGDGDTIDPPKGTPEPPKKLTGDAKAEWDRMVARLRETGALSMVDDAALYQYAHLFADTELLKADALKLRKIRDKLLLLARKLNGIELVDAMDKIVSLSKLVDNSPLKLRQQRMAIRMYLVEFGMTPAARTRVKLPKGSKPDVNPNHSRFFGGNSNRPA